MRAKLTNLNYCAEPFLSRAALNLYGVIIYTQYSEYYTLYTIQYTHGIVISTLGIVLYTQYSAYYTLYTI